MGDIENPLLRPLSIGEIFDRAITLLVRNWAPFTIIAAIGVVPSGICDYLALTVSPSFGPLSRLLTLLISVATMAAARVVAQIYRREELNWRSAIVYGLSRIPAVFGVGFIVVLAAIVPLLILVGVPAGMGAFKFGNIVSDLVAGVSLLCAGAIVLAMSFGASYALAAIAISEDGVFASLSRAVGLFTQRTSAGRTFIFALAQQLILLGGSAMGGALDSIARTATHNSALGTIVESILLFIATALGNVLIGVFYFDVAVRREGYDMQVELESMPA